jgi:Pentapeptide repeats (8 copies)
MVTSSDSKAGSSVPSTRKLPGQAQEPQPRRLLWILLFVGLGCVAAATSTAVVFGSWPECWARPRWLDGLQLAAKRNPPWLIISGLATAPALILTWWWRTTHKDQDLGLARQGAALARREELAKRFFEAVKLLAEDGAEARLGALYALEDLVRVEPDEYCKVAETICGFLRERCRMPAYEGRPPTDIQAAFTIICRLTPEGYSGRSPVELTGLIMPGLDATNARLAGANLAGSDLNNCSFEGADLTGAILPCANFQKSVLSKCRLRGANLRGARLRYAKLDGADLTATSLEQADLEETDRAGAEFLGSIYDKNTKLPPDMDPVKLHFMLVSPISPDPDAPAL